jgi:hypothetical protein
MKKVPAIVIVSILILITFAGAAQGSWWLKAWSQNNTGWQYLKTVGGYDYYYKTHYNYREMWMENQDVIYIPSHMHEQIHYEIKVTDGNRPVGRERYHYVYHISTVGPRSLTTGYKQLKVLTNTDNLRQYVGVYDNQNDFTWSIGDTAEIHDILFAFVPLEDIPLLDHITIVDNTGKVIADIEFTL